MIKKIYFILYIYLLSTFIIPPICLGETVLTFAAPPKIPPVIYSDSKGVAKGLFVDIFYEIAIRSGFKTRIKLLPFRRIDSYLKDGTIEGSFAIFYKKEREKYLVYCETPILISRNRVFVKKGRGFTFRITEDLFGKRIGRIAGWSVNNSEIDQAVKEGRIITDEAPNYKHNLEKLVAGRIDCAILTEQLAWYHANEIGVDHIITVLDKSVSKNISYIAISKNSTKITAPNIFIKKINSALISIKNDGTYEELLIKYGIVNMKGY